MTFPIPLANARDSVTFTIASPSRGREGAVPIPPANPRGSVAFSGREGALRP
jgi:hypothetical protein